MANLVRDVNGQNYSDKVEKFIASGGKFTMIIEKDIPLRGSWSEWGDYPPHQNVRGKQSTPEQWRAWIRYFVEKNILHAFMFKRHYYCVPAPWPSEFDADWTIANDQQGRFDA